MDKALLVIDMLKEYLDKNGKVYTPECRSIIKSVQQTINYAHENNIAIFYVNTCLVNENSPLAKKWGMHAEKGSFGSKIIKDLEPTGADFIIEKQGYDGFFKTNLDYLLSERGVKELYITGIHTHVCVRATATTAFQLGYDVSVIEDCVTTKNTEKHISSLAFFESHIGKLITKDEFIK